LLQLPTQFVFGVDTVFAGIGLEKTAIDTSVSPPKSCHSLHNKTKSRFVAVNSSLLFLRKSAMVL